jgi:hypothetical protein
MSTPPHPSEVGSAARKLYDDFARMRKGEKEIVDADILALFHFQATNNLVYQRYIAALGRSSETVKEVVDIPFMPIAFFKSHAVKSWDFEPNLTFTSSGTTGQVNSKHYLSNPITYEDAAIQIFETTYGPCKDWVFLALLPSYLERTGSSLIHMVDCFIRKSAQPESGFFLYEHERLREAYNTAKNRGQKVFILGVSYALLDLAASTPFKLATNDVLMETGGMKGRRSELIREELHAQLMHAFGIAQVHSEYGMTELLSQAYAPAEGLYTPPPWMKIYIRDVNDPFRMLKTGKTGGINIIDLANIDSCAFLQTQDLGRLAADGRFEVLGRFDNSELRGCNLMVG